MFSENLSEYIQYKLQKNLKKHGLGGTLKVLLLKIGELMRGWTPRYRRLKSIEREFDRKHGVKTDCIITLDELDVADHAQFRNDYQATPPPALRALLTGLEIPYSDFTFVDLGSGMGRAVLIASEFPFRKIIGVEFSSELHQIARQNVLHFKSGQQKCRNIELVHGDVVEYALPAEKTVFYLYNPFQRPVLEKMLENLRASLSARPREIWILYIHPLEQELLEKAPFLERMQSGEASPGVYAFAVYRNKQRPARGG